MFELINPDGKCMVPGESSRDGGLVRTVVASETCPGHWQWTQEGQMKWHGPLPWQTEKVTCGQHQAATCAECPRDESTGNWAGDHFCHGDCRWEEETCVAKSEITTVIGFPLCLTSVKTNYPVTVARCRPLAEDQMVELGQYTVHEGRITLMPKDEEEWQARQDRARKMLLEETKVPVTKALEEIAQDDLVHLLDQKTGKVRRAVVFYLDKGESGLQQLKWWLHAWKLIGLDEAEEAFDVVLMVHPDAVPRLPEECKRIEEGFTAKHVGKGACLYHPYMGIAYRDPSLDMYMNSQECLIGPGTEFLDGYRVLLRFNCHSCHHCYPHCGLYHLHCHNQGRHGHFSNPWTAWLLAGGGFAEQPLWNQLQPSQVFHFFWF